jgi:hypothetical protein
MYISMAIVLVIIKNIAFVKFLSIRKGANKKPISNKATTAFVLRKL